jgi:alpha-1,2-mannosyltransferase
MYHYALALRRSSFLMVNSSWTKNHVDAILVYADPVLDLIHFPLTCIGGLTLSLIHVLAHSLPTHAHATPRQAATVYPPCDTHALSQLPLDRRSGLLLSLAQFRYKFPPFFLLLYSLEDRPEKDHAAQIHMMAALLKRYPEHRQAVRLLLVGGVRNEEDSARVDNLKALADSLQVTVNAAVSAFILSLADRVSGHRTISSLS